MKIEHSSTGHRLIINEARNIEFTRAYRVKETAHWIGNKTAGKVALFSGPLLISVLIAKCH